MRRFWLAGLIVGLLTILTHPAHADGRRVALVIGNAAYKRVAALSNPGHDAELMARTLSGLGFKLIGGSAQVNLGRSEFEQAVRQFGRDSAGAEIAVFYYAGHGLRNGGENWLVPIDATLQRRDDLDFEAVNVKLVLRQMEAANTKLNIVLLDACRDDSFVRQPRQDASRGIKSGGLAEMSAPDNTLISYSAQPGRIALDGGTSNSPYTAALSLEMRRPGVDLLNMLNDVGVAVRRATNGEQQPWLANSPIDSKIYLAGMAPTAPGPAPAVSTASRPSSPDIAPPQPLLLEPASAFPGKFLPRIGPDGQVPRVVYARPSDQKSDRPRIALLLTDLAMSGATSQFAIEALPGPIDFAISPYADQGDTEALLKLSRARGHETLISLPLEPEGYPLNDAGSRSLLAQAPAEQNANNLQWTLSRAQGYIGAVGTLATMHGERFAADKEAWNAMLGELHRRGLLYIDPRPGANASGLLAVPGRQTDVLLRYPAQSIAPDLEELEQIALARGSALGIGVIDARTVQIIAAWTKTLPARGIDLVPVSSLVVDSGR